MLLGRYRVKTYKFGEFGKEDITLLEKILNHIKKNKVMYARLVLVTTLILNYNMNFVFANSVEASLDYTFSQIIELIKVFAK